MQLVATPIQEEFYIIRNRNYESTKNDNTVYYNIYTSTYFNTRNTSLKYFDDAIKSLKTIIINNENSNIDIKNVKNELFNVYR